MTTHTRSGDERRTDRVRQTVGAILAGGRSRRFGSQKSRAEIGGTTLLERLISAHRAVFEQILVISDPLEVDELADVEVLPDIRPGAGPLGGLHTGLVRAREIGAEGICCTPCDAPFVTPNLLRLLTRESHDFDVVLPEGRAGHPFEPLIGWYARETIPAVESALAEGDFALHRLVNRLGRVRILTHQELSSRIDTDSAFFNVNTPEDLELARRMDRRRGR